MKTILKLFCVYLTILLINPLYAEQAPFFGGLLSFLQEPQVVEEIQLECSELVPALLNACTADFDQHERNLFLCMQKRDQCLVNTQRPADQSSCLELDQCMRAPERGLFGLLSPAPNQLPGCDYYWDRTMNQCASKRPILGSSHHCPGRRRLSTISTFGMADSYDSNFNCTSHARMLEQHIVSCRTIKEQVLTHCHDDVRLSTPELIPSFETRVLAQFEQQTFQADPLERREHISDVVRSPIPPRRPEDLNLQRGQTSGAVNR
jgi:hypothetical protein